MKNFGWFFLTFIWPFQVLAADVFVDGKKIPDLRNKVYSHCQVEIDQRGNIYISTEDFLKKKVQRTKTDVIPTHIPLASPTERYWLVTEKAVPGMALYDIDVFINARMLRKMLDQEEHVVLEITRYLHQGPNKVLFVAKKKRSSTRPSASPQHYFRIIIGEGEESGRNVMINKQIIDYRRTAFETKDYQDEFILHVQ